MYEAVFFDLDGTLIDTETLALRSNRLVFEAHGHEVDEAFLHSMIGKDLPTMNAVLRRVMPELDLERFAEEATTAFLHEMERGLELKPGVRQLLNHLPLPKVVVTSSGRASAHHKISLTGIADAFVDVISVDDVTRAKPAPEPYLLAAERLGVNPKRCLVFEDSEIGAEAGHRAGCTVVQVEDVLKPSGRWAHHVAKDLLSGARMAGLMA
ncbi:HAD family hydrolase [Pseudogemmobacter faecipullorum]|uniref:HAD family phosphatase n=1 Tax=Pseudogemmobacter faecipullorum TaxID=2755041 RepID=A0ABS8CJH3_9RHOB|nr:HAD family phosphatase [Pseudogemmobacter faecipullorum]MCB5409534.1 HAD family phosphatase [Pseudogemmobacter faecipullorum]